MTHPRTATPSAPGPARLAALAICLAFAAHSLPARAGEKLGLDAYLSEVGEHHQGVQASRTASEGALLHSGEGKLLLAPTIYGDGQLGSDAKKNAFFQYDKVITNNFALGVSQLTSFGLQAKLSYSHEYFHYQGLSVPAFYEGRPMLEITQSLWKNSFGAETRANQELLKAGALATHYSESFKAKAILSDAESAYWRLALARQNVTVSKDAFARSQKLYDWNARRARLHLGDQADLLQAEAALELRKLQLQGAEDDERAAARAFNLQRGNASEEVPESLTDLDATTLDHLSVPVRARMRDDVLAAEQGQRAASANATVSLNRISPTLELYGLTALNSRSAGGSDAFYNAFHTDQPSTVVGLRFSAPIDLSLIRDTREGWRKEQAAADLTYQRKLFEQEQDWTDLNSRLTDSKKRLDLSRSIEAAQGKKLTYEKERLNHGRTTTYQVLLFEQDFAQAQLSRIQAQAEVLNIIARMKLFAGTDPAAPQGEAK